MQFTSSIHHDSAQRYDVQTKTINCNSIGCPIVKRRTFLYLVSRMTKDWVKIGLKHLLLSAARNPTKNARMARTEFE